MEDHRCNKLAKAVGRRLAEAGYAVITGRFSGMVQILGFSGNSTDRPRASTVEVLSVVGPIADSGTLEAVQAQHV
jgi:hypothetical protein